MAKTNIFENDTMNLLATVSVELKDETLVVPVLGIMDNNMYIQYMKADGSDFGIRVFGIPKNVLDSRRYAELLTGYWYLSTLQGLKRKQNSLESKKDKTDKDRQNLELIKLPINFTESVIATNNYDKVEYPTTIKSTVWAVNSGAWTSADGKTRFWVLGGKGLADDIVSYAKGKMSKADFKDSYCKYTAQWLQTGQNGDAETFGDLFRNFTPKATDIMVSDLVNCYKGVKLQYKEDIGKHGLRGQALVAQAVLQMLKTVYKFDDKNTGRKQVIDAEI